MSFDVRLIARDEFAAWSDAVHVGFFAPGSRGERAGHERYRVDGACWAAFEGDDVVGTLAGVPYGMTVPGGEVIPVAGITAATVLPTHRRLGLLTRMLDAELAAAVERGQAASLLVAAEWPIYGRFGYGPATDGVTVTVDAQRARLRRPGPPGRVRLVEPAEFRAAAPAVYDRLRLRTAGAVTRRAEDWNPAVAKGHADAPSHETLYALFEDSAGAVVGYTKYAMTASWENEIPHNQLKVLELAGDDAHVEAALWSYLWSHDWVADIIAWNRAVDDPLPLLLDDARMLRQVLRSDHLWLRILDTAAALASRRCESSGRIVLRITDKAGYAAGTFEFEGTPEGSTCRATGRDPDVTLPVSTLGSIYIGYLSATRAVRAGLLDEERPGAAARLGALFNTGSAPWAPTKF